MSHYAIYKKAAERSGCKEKSIQPLCSKGHISNAKKIRGIFRVAVRKKPLSAKSQPIGSFTFNVKCLYGQNTKIYEQKPKLSEKTKDSCVVKSIELFPGAMLIFQDIHTEHLDFSKNNVAFPPNVISIQHCREGRFEGEYQNGECFYLGPGDLSINLPFCQPKQNSFPLSHYHGLNLIIDTQAAQQYIMDIEKLVGQLHIDLKKLSDSLKKGNHLIIYRENVLEHIMSELYFMKEESKDGSIRMKVLEFLHCLCSQKASSPIQPVYFNHNQVKAVKEIQAYLTEHPQEHKTLEELSDKFQIPLTSMKTCFKGVYGMSVKAYLREYRLQLAAELLKEKSAGVGDIAFQVGYESPSKFAEAFRKKFNCAPSEYRRETFFRE